MHVKENSWGVKVRTILLCLKWDQEHCIISLLIALSSYNSFVLEFLEYPISEIPYLQSRHQQSLSSISNILIMGCGLSRPRPLPPDSSYRPSSQAPLFATKESLHSETDSDAASSPCSSILPTRDQTLRQRQQQECHERCTGHGVAYNRLISEEEEQRLRKAAMKERLRRGTRDEIERREREENGSRASAPKSLSVYWL